MSAATLSDPSFVTPRDRAHTALDSLRKTLAMLQGKISTTGKSFEIPLLAAIVNAELAQGKEARGAFNERHPQVFDTLTRTIVSQLQRDEGADFIIDETIRPALKEIGIALP